MFRKKVIEDIGLLWKDANESNEYLRKLKKKQVQEIRVEGDFLRSKLSWKIAIYSQAVRYRLIELVESCIEQWNKEKFVSCFIVSRSIIETVCVLYDFKLKLNKALSTKDINLLDEIVMNKTFSSRLDDLFDNKINSKAVNILTLINKLDKDFPGLKDVYENLSEYAHTNYFGVLNAYAEIDYKTGDVKFKSQNNKKNVFMRLHHIFVLIELGNHLFDKIEEYIKLTAEIHIAEEKNKS